MREAINWGHLWKLFVVFVEPCISLYQDSHHACRLLHKNKSNKKFSREVKTHLKQEEQLSLGDAISKSKGTKFIFAKRQIETSNKVLTCKMVCRVSRKVIAASLPPRSTDFFPTIMPSLTQSFLWVKCTHCVWMRIFLAAAEWNLVCPIKHTQRLFYIQRDVQLRPLPCVVQNDRQYYRVNLRICLSLFQKGTIATLSNVALLYGLWKRSVLQHMCETCGESKSITFNFVW